MTLEALRREATVYLIWPARRDPQKSLRRHFKKMFVEQLAGWYRDEEHWPKDLSFPTFCTFFEVHVASLVFELNKGPVVKEDEDE